MVESECLDCGQHLYANDIEHLETLKKDHAKTHMVKVKKQKRNFLCRLFNCKYEKKYLIDETILLKNIKGMEGIPVKNSGPYEFICKRCGRIRDVVQPTKKYCKECSGPLSVSGFCLNKKCPIDTLVKKPKELKK